MERLFGNSETQLSSLSSQSLHTVPENFTHNFTTINLPLTTMSDQARQEVNNAITSSGSGAVGLVVDAGKASQEKREKLRREREKREAEEKAAREKASVCGPSELSVI
jgi:hypothetical protein